MSFPGYPLAAHWVPRYPKVMHRSFGSIVLCGGGEAGLGAAWANTGPAYRSLRHVLYHVVDGQCEVEVDGTWHAIVPGSLWLLTANHWHRRRCRGRALQRFLHFRLSSLAVDSALSRHAGIVDLPLEPAWQSAMADQVRLWDAARRLPTEAATALVWRLEGLIQHLVASRVGDLPLAADDPLVTRAIAYLEAHHRERPGASEVAARVGCSVRTLGERFQRTLGLGVMAYAERRRMEEAERLLTTTDLPIAAVGDACGYPDPLHFSRVVRRHCGRSPRQVREQG